MAAHPFPLPTARRVGWLLTVPKLGIVLLLAAVVALLWLVHRNEVDEERATLIKDVLWLEQNLRFHLTGNEELLQQLAADMTGPVDRHKLFRLRAGSLLKNNPELAQILWQDARREVRDALPADAPPDSGIEAFGPPVTQKAFELASRLGKRIYSEPFLTPGNQANFEMVVPIFDERTFTGVLVAVYPVDALLNHLVPWWFAEKYQVLIIDESDIQYGTKSKVQSVSSETYEIPLDPPGYGLKLKVTRYQSSANPLQRILAAAIVVLAIVVFWSLWSIRDLMRKRAQAEAALRSEHAFRKAMEDSLTVGMRARDLDGRIIYVNPAFCRMTGFPSDQLVGRQPPMPYWVPEQMEETYALHQSVLAGEAPTDGFQLTFMRKNGERFQALVYEAPLIDGNGHHTGWMASILDITERMRAEELARQQHEQLQFTSRLVTMGEMASTLAHELNQPLAAIASYNAGCLNLLASNHFNPADVRQALDKLGVQAQRAGRIIRRVHDFVRKSEPKRAPCRVAEVVEDCLSFVEAEGRKRGIRIECDIQNLPVILADRLMLEQVLLNLIRNAMEAMTETPREHAALSVRAAIRDADIVVSVADNGSGLAPEVREKLFTAFFTTKADGMGVGLSICRSIIEFHRGRLVAEDNPASPTGSGTIFTFTLPLEVA